MYEASGYGSGLKPPDDWPHKTWLALIHTGDNQGPPPPDQVEKLLGQAERDLPGVKVRMGRLSDFADALLAEKPDLPVIRADMPDTWIHGIMSMPLETSMARRIRPEIGALEALNTLLRTWGVEVSPVEGEVAEAYEGSLMYGEHTWGYSMSPFGYHYGQEWADLRAKGHYARLEGSWEEKGEHIRKNWRRVAQDLGLHTHVLARSVKVDGPRIVVFNPLPWTRDASVVAFVEAGLEGRLLDAESGDVVRVMRRTKARGYENTTITSFVARSIPPLGYRTFVCTKDPSGAPVPFAARRKPAQSEAARTIENEHFRVEIDPSRGVVALLVDRRSGRVLVDRAWKYGLGQCVYERFDSDNIDAYFKSYLKYVPGWSPHFARGNLPPSEEAPYSLVSPKRSELYVSQTDVATAAHMSSAADEGFLEGTTVSVTLPPDGPYVDLGCMILGKKPDPWPEAGWLCLPFRIDEPSFRLGRLGSVVDPAKDARRGSNFEVFCISSGMTITGPDGKGVGLCPIDSPLVSIGHPGLYQYSKEFGSREPVVFVNVFNNVWGTNFQQWTEGTWQSRVRIWAVEGKGIEADLITPSWEARAPCKAAFFDGPAGTLPPSQSGIELSRKGVLVTAFGPNPDGEGMLFRLWEQAGEDGICRVRLPDGMEVKQAQPCDLRGRPRGEPLAVRDGSIEVPLTHFAPASLLLEPAE
jgi:hypothetical protein